MPKWVVEVPTLDVLVMGWASSGELKGFFCIYFLFVQVQRGETQRKFSSQSCPVFHSPQSCIQEYKIWIFVPCETQGNQLLLLAEVYILAVGLFWSVGGFPAVVSYFSWSSSFELPSGACWAGPAAAGLGHPLVFLSLPVSWFAYLHLEGCSSLLDLVLPHKLADAQQIAVSLEG